MSDVKITSGAPAALPAREDVPTSSRFVPEAPSPARAAETVQDALVERLAMREAYRERYWEKHDPILADRLLWRAQSVRHTVHLLPGQTILELGAGRGRFTHALLGIIRGENPLTAVTFNEVLLPNVARFGSNAVEGQADCIEEFATKSLPGALAGRKFDCVVAMDLLDDTTSSDLLSIIFDLLKPGGEAVFYESNPWNPVHKLRYAFSSVFGRKDPRVLLSRPRLYELLSEIGFIRVYAVYNDFVYAPLTRPLIWFLRNLSILLENAPVISCTAGSILLHAQKPPRHKARPRVAFLAPESLRRAVSVVVPCYNEEGTVRALITSLLELYGDYIHEIVPVNDNSRDRTGEILDALAVLDARVKPLHRKPPNGVGRAIADGLRATTGRYVLTLDCDFQHLLPELRDILTTATEGYDVVIGSRFSRHSVMLNYPFPKIVANRAFHTLARFILGRNFRDVTNNLKLLRREVVNDLNLRQPGFAINAETGLQPYLLGYWVREVPISWINRTPGMGSSSFRLVKVGGGYFQVLMNLWKWRIFRRGAYAGLRRTAHVSKA